MQRMKMRLVRDIESALGVFYQEILPNHKKPQQRFQVFLRADKEEEIGEINSEGLFFRQRELVKKTLALLVTQKPIDDQN